MKTKIIFIGLSLVTAGFIMTGCGSDSGSDAGAAAGTTVSGQLADSYIANADFECGDKKKGTTDKDGRFSCDKFPVKFTIGNLELGSINSLPADKHVFPQDLVGVGRDDVNNSDVVAMAQFLQACDDDNNTANGIQIRAEIRKKLQRFEDSLNAQTVEAVAMDLNVKLTKKDTAVAHLEHTTKFVKDVHQHSKNIPGEIQDIILTPNSTLTQEAKNTLSYMGNEERLAHDLYLELYNYHQDKGTDIRLLSTLATTSETTHIQVVQALTKKYITNADEFTNTDLKESNHADIGAEYMKMGVYDISDIQKLHNTLIETGKESKEAALKVGCMVEVTDIDDLTKSIEIAKDSNATDIVEAFTFLKRGSYFHYWAFDKNLKERGVENGCCSAGDKYCHDEYPEKEKAVAQEQAQKHQQVKKDEQVQKGDEAQKRDQARKDEQAQRGDEAQKRDQARKDEQAQKGDEAQKQDQARKDEQAQRDAEAQKQEQVKKDEIPVTFKNN